MRETHSETIIIDQEAKMDIESSIRRMRIDVELQEIDAYCRSVSHSQILT